MNWIKDILGTEPERKKRIRPAFQSLFFLDELQFAKTLENSPEPIAAFRQALDVTDQHLQQRFFEGEDIHQLVRDRSSFIDRLIYYAWMKFDWDEDIALYAVGGYGRGEMHPHSDIDLLFLLRKDRPEKYRDSIEAFLTFLWDLQLQIGQSVRTAKQCLEAAKLDVTVMTNLLERRMIVGMADMDTALKEQLEHAWPARQFFHAKRDEQKLRHAKHGITEFDLEPNVKESPGGLRDIQTIHWVAKHAYGIRRLEQLAGRSFYIEEEYNSLRAAEVFLWRVRFGLHILSSRPKERLDFESQRQLAEMLGFRDTPQRMAVEQFMQRYYLAASSVREITDVLMQLLEQELDGGAVDIASPINERFQIRGKYLETRSPQVFPETPSALIEIFVLLAHHPEIEGISGHTIRQIREHGYLVNSDFRNAADNRQWFVKLLKSPDNLPIPLQKMSRYAILGRYLPEFGQIIGLTQHDLFHIYPVDIHTMAVITNILKFSDPEAKSQFPVSTYAYSSCAKPELLVIAGLFHDIGKGRGGDHSELGAVDVERFASNHGFSERDSRLLQWLVLNHLFMSRVAQREDISDPEIIARFARHVGDESRLNMLYVLTTADILATNPTLWNNWRASLMRQLYTATQRLLKRGLNTVVEPAELIRDTQTSATQQLQEKAIAPEQYQQYWSQLGDSYFLRESADDLVWHTELLVTNHESTAPLVSIKPLVHYQRERATQIFIRTEKSQTLFYAAATVMGNAGLSIQDVRLYETHHHSLLILYVLDENSAPFSRDQARVERLKVMLYNELGGDQDRSGIHAGRTPRRLKQFPVRTQTHLSQVGEQTLLEVITADRAGLLASIAEMFVKNDVILKSARITTLGERVEDLFVIENVDGSPLTENQKTDKLQRDIRETIDQKVEESAGIV